jgi:dTDP-3,4-didehydro-2,6-dideoxy-alpha-D-glucose 3-reductase
VTAIAERIKIGVLGCANIAERYILPAMLEHSGYEVVGIASRNGDKVRSFSDKFSIPGYEGYEKILEAGPDAVYIPLPNSMHFEWVKKALEAGCHVLVEKSLGCNYLEVERLTALAQEKSLCLMENFQFRFHPQLRLILGMLEEGLIGDLRAMRSYFGFPPFTDDDNIRYNKDLGGGALLDAGAYPLKLSTIVFGKSIEVASAKLHFDNERGVDLWGSGLLVNADNEVASHISFGFDNHYQCLFELWGSKGKLFTDRIFTAPPGYKPKVQHEHQGGLDIIEVPQANHFDLMLDHFQREVLSGASDVEREMNLVQARLISSFLEKANQ